MAAIDDLPPLRDVIRRHDLIARKSLGQNFLLDLNLTGKIARAARTIKDACVFEIGPGPGGLTRAILENGAKKLIAIEYDPRAIAALQGLKDASGGRLEIIQADALLSGEAEGIGLWTVVPHVVLIALIGLCFWISPAFRYHRIEYAEPAPAAPYEHYDDDEDGMYLGGA